MNQQPDTSQSLDGPLKRKTPPMLVSTITNQMLDQIAEVPDLLEQSSLFVVTRLLLNANTRWLQTECLLRRPWILWDHPDEDQKRLFILSDKVQKVLIFESRDGRTWKRDRAVTLEEAEAMIPKPFRYTSWMAEPATPKQLNILANISDTLNRKIPALCSINVSALLVTRRMLIRNTDMCYQIECWEYDIDSNYDTQQPLSAQMPECM